MPEPSRAGSAPLLDNPWFKVRLCCQTGLTRLLGFQTDRRQLGSSMPELSELSNGHSNSSLCPEWHEDEHICSVCPEAQHTAQLMQC